MLRGWLTLPLRPRVEEEDDGAGEDEVDETALDDDVVTGAAILDEEPLEDGAEVASGLSEGRRETLIGALFCPERYSEAFIAGSPPGVSGNNSSQKSW